ncbi:hypothetical protein BS47DRAFT_1486467 [Hydnum rufescens UP504]|uniref:Uncharacterized protein n=1 Tax=Hydnum rufescens UP504 TaxID=1448309 RepID=A0A9P6DUX0_9AGAM|nr:hypothetical protein BS47DRAFT_1486467 [Hydnum rufescens UP504]
MVIEGAYYKGADSREPLDRRSREPSGRLSEEAPPRSGGRGATWITFQTKVKQSNKISVKRNTDARSIADRSPETQFADGCSTWHKIHLCVSATETMATSYFIVNRELSANGQRLAVQLDGLGVNLTMVPLDSSSPK